MKHYCWKQPPRKKLKTRKQIHQKERTKGKIIPLKVALRHHLKKVIVMIVTIQAQAPQEPKMLIVKLH